MRKLWGLNENYTEINKLKINYHYIKFFISMRIRIVLDESASSRMFKAI